MLCRLVAHHSCAIVEAEERGLADVLRREFAAPPQPLADALTCCDMTTSPDGEPMNVDRRLAEIHHRYGSGHLVSRSIRRATPMILQAVGKVTRERPALRWAPCHRPNTAQRQGSTLPRRGSAVGGRPRVVVTGFVDSLRACSRRPWRSRRTRAGRDGRTTGTARWSMAARGGSAGSAVEGRRGAPGRAARAGRPAARSRSDRMRRPGPVRETRHAGMVRKSKKTRVARLEANRRMSNAAIGVDVGQLGEASLGEPAGSLAQERTGQQPRPRSVPGDQLQAPAFGDAGPPRSRR